MQIEDAVRIGTSGSVNSTDVSGAWVNQLGSRVVFAASGSNLTGTFTNSETGTSNALVGFVDGNLIAFSVLFPSTGISSWVGEVENLGSTPTMTTLWQMTSGLPSDNEPDGAIFAGSDTFTYQSSS